MAKQMSVFGVVKQVHNKDSDQSPLSALTQEPVDKMKAGSAVLTEDVQAEDVVFCEKPLAIVLKDEMAENKICPLEMTLMTAPVQCTLGSSALFSSETVRDMANQTYHRYEHKTIEQVKQAGIGPKAKLALRVVTNLGSKNVKTVLRGGSGTAPEELQQHVDDEMARRTIQLIGNEVAASPSAERDFEIILLTSFLVSCLEKGDFFEDNTEKDVTELVYRVVKSVMTHSRSVYYSQGSVDKSQLWSISKIPVKDFAIGVFPEYSLKLKNAKFSETANALSFFHRGALFMQAIRKVEKGNEINVRISAAGASSVAFPANMINYKCSAPGCTLSFPLDKSQVQPIKCPLEDCNVETNIWKKLKRIQELKRDHEAARRDIEFNEDGKEGIRLLKATIQELEAIVCRPDKFLNTLDEDLAKTLVLKHMESEQQWLQENK